MDSVTVGLFLLIAGAVLYLRARHRLRSAEREDAWRPPELRGAPIVYAEKQFFASLPIRLVARVDRGLRTGRGIVLAELKTRSPERPYMSDVIELSAQKLALEESAGEVVSRTAYVVTQHPTTGTRRTHPVRLLNTAEVIALARRRERIIAGTERARIAWNRSLCRPCAFFEQCRPDRTAHGE